MKRKVLSLMLSAAMVFSLFACGQNDVPSTSSESKVVEAQTSETKESTPQVAEEPKEIREVTWLTIGDQPEDFDKVIEATNEILRERYALELNMIQVASNELVTRSELMITSGEDFDLMYVNKKTFDPNVAREAFLPLDDLLENSEIGKKLMEVYPEGLADFAIRKGATYALPNYQMIYTQPAAYVQKNLAEEYGLDLNATYNTIVDLEPFMDWVLANKKDIWPLAESGVLSQAFGADKSLDNWSEAVATQYNACFKADGSIDVELAWTQEADIKIARMWNTYFKKGYLRSDLATVTDNSADLLAGRYAIVTSGNKPYGEVDLSTKYGIEFVRIPLGTPYIQYNGPVATMTAVNVNSKNPEAALEMLYVMWTDEEVVNMLNYGLEGEHYKKISADRVETIDGSKYTNTTLGWQLGNQFIVWKMQGQEDDIYDLTLELNANAIQSPLKGFQMDTSNVSTELSLFNAANKEVGSGYKYAEDFDAWLANAVATLKAACGAELEAEYQKQIDAWLATK